MALWLTCIVISTLSFFVQTHHMPALSDFIAAHISFFFFLPVIFAGLFSYFDFLAIINIIIFWPLIAFLHYKIVRNLTMIWFLILACVLLSISPFWLSGFITSMGV